MSSEDATTEPVFRLELIVPEDAVDDNGHVNNVVYIQWMQDVAVRHSDAMGGTRAMHGRGCTWVVRSHKIEYLSPSFAGDRIDVLTWVANIRRVSSLRRYRFVRIPDGKVLARGETEWVFVSTPDGRPRSIPEEVSRCYPVLPDPE